MAVDGVRVSLLVNTGLVVSGVEVMLDGAVSRDVTRDDNIEESTVDIENVLVASTLENSPLGLSRGVLAAVVVARVVLEAGITGELDTNDDDNNDEANVGDDVSDTGWLDGTVDEKSLDDIRSDDTTLVAAEGRDVEENGLELESVIDVVTMVLFKDGVTSAELDCITEDDGRRVVTPGELDGNKVEDAKREVESTRDVGCELGKLVLEITVELSADDVCMVLKTLDVATTLLLLLFEIITEEDEVTNSEEKVDVDAMVVSDISDVEASFVGRLLITVGVGTGVENPPTWRFIRTSFLSSSGTAIRVTFHPIT